jgi:hypothetical protein
MSGSSEAPVGPRRQAAVDRELVERLRLALRHRAEVIERLWFGGVVFSVRGRMALGVLGGTYLVRIGTLSAIDRFGTASVRAFEIAGTPLRGWVRVDAGALSGEALGEWITRALAYVETIPD